VYDVLGSVLRAGLTWASRRRLPTIDGALNLPGLSAPVEVIRDRWGVPHLYASTMHDLFFAQGFVHSQDRLWQMELNRRIASGRLSELFGEMALATDRASRTLGFHRLAGADWERAGDELHGILAAYADGVNTFLESREYRRNKPIEFTLLNHHPEPWRPLDSLAFARVMIWQLSHAWYSEIIRARLIQAVGEEAAAELEIHPLPDCPVTLPAGIEFNRMDAAGRLHAAGGPFLRQGMGSNAWAVCGRRTATGKPFLCNDMHLPIPIPGIWYQVHLAAADFQVTGVSLPGVPLVLVGHNARIAWGMTLTFIDAQDLFVEQFDPAAPHRYRFRDEWREARVIPERIHIKGRAGPHVEEVLITHHGPIVSGVAGYPEQKVALSSVALRPCPVTQGWLQLNRAGDWDEFVEAMRLIEAPQLNVAYADVDGNVGHWATGRVPVRARGQGLVPVPGWTGEYEWTGQVPFEEMPHAFNPEQGYVVTCNNQLVADDYPYYLGSAWMNGYRARRVCEAIGGKEQLTAADFQALQMDVTCIPGQEFVRRLEDFVTGDPDARLALELLRAWDGRLTPDSVGGCVYEVARYTLVRSLLEPGLGEELTLQLMGRGFDPVLAPSHEFYGHDTVATLRMLDNPGSWWLARAGGREAALEASLRQAIAWLRGRLGPDPGGWQWGRIHRVVFLHAFGLREPLDRVFNWGPRPIGGDTDTPCQTAMAAGDPYDNKAWAPSFRQIVDLGDLSRSLAALPPGQSGQLGSPHYDDLAELWIKGEYYPMLWTREQVEREAEGRLILRPGRAVMISSIHAREGR
jgi:penicillin amidase